MLFPNHTCSLIARANLGFISQKVLHSSLSLYATRSSIVLCFVTNIAISERPCVISKQLRALIIFKSALLARARRAQFLRRNNKDRGTIKETTLWILHRIHTLCVYTTISWIFFVATSDLLFLPALSWKESLKRA